MTDRPAFTLAWFALVLAVVFTIALWVGRTVGPETADPDPVAPVAPQTHHGAP